MEMSNTLSLALWFTAWAWFLSIFQLVQGQGGPLNAVVSLCQELGPSPILEKFVDELPRLNTINTSNAEQLIMSAYKIQQKLHRDLPPTTLYAFGTSNKTASYPGPTLEALQNVVSYVRWENHISDNHHMLAVDHSVMWANPRSGGVPIVPHLHGAEAHSIFDGHPDAWFTAAGDHGYAYITQNYTYSNSQEPTMLWYHDHTFGVTRLSVLSGLAGLYIIRSKEAIPAWMPTGNYEVPLFLQDKQFFANGSINFPNVGDSPSFHPQWCPEYFGDTILVNGKAWPYLQIEPRLYRFRLLNAANARVFELSLNNENLSFIQIGTDQGLLDRPQTLKNVTVAPGERVDFIIDFSSVAGSDVYMNNTGQAPYPDGNPAFSPESTYSVVKFIVSARKENQSDLIANQSVAIPGLLRESKRSINIENALWRTNFMFEMDDAEGNPLHSLLSNRSWTDAVTETPYIGSTEVWEFINLTPDAHPMHIHLIHFQLLNQQAFNLTLFQNGGCRLFNTSHLEPGNCFIADPVQALSNQVGRKDTILSLPNHVTRLVVRWTNQTGGDFPFDATTGPGYVWHCHILDHEDNDMMRPIKLMPTVYNSTTSPASTNLSTQWTVFLAVTHTLLILARMIYL